MNKIIKRCHVLKVLTYLSIFGLTFVFLNFQIMKEIFAFEPIIQPQQGDYLRYNFTSFDMFGIPNSTTFNLSFSRPPFTVVIEGEEFELNNTFFPNFIKATVEVGDWAVLGVTPEPEDEACYVVNVTDRRMFATYPFNNSYVGYGTPYFEFIISTDPAYVYTGAEIPIRGESDIFIVVGPDNMILYGEYYPVWILSNKYDDTYEITYKFEASSGILLWMNWTSILGEYTYVTIFELIEAKIGDLEIIPEFSSLIILSLFMLATLLAVIVYRRKHTIC